MARGKHSAAASSREAASGRGSPEAIQKRRVARRLNDLMLGRKAVGTRRDGRTEKRRRRLLAELEKGTKNPDKGLKAIDVLRHVHDLLELGEPISSIRKVTRIRPHPEISVEEAVTILRDLHSAYRFRAEVYRFLGLPSEALTAARIADSAAPRRGRPPKSA
jgi:hypothetical protein